MDIVCCFDLGGTTINCAQFDLAGTIQEFETLPSKNDKEYILDTINTYLNQVVQSHKLVGIGLSVPGMVDVERGVVNGFSALQNLHEFNYISYFHELYNVPVVIENDANAALLGEYYNGHAKDKDNAILISVGTGIGGALMESKNLVRGRKNLAGEFGFMLQHQKENTYVSLNELTSLALLVKRINQEDYITITSAKEAFDLAESGDGDIKKIIDDFYRNLAVGIYNLNFSFDPDVILLSGAISERSNFDQQLQNHVNQLIDESVERFLGKHVDSKWLYPIIKACKNGNKSNVIGMYSKVKTELKL
ncbi:hypothetical protein A4S06_08780 [Erysipelotrichaceae bacterium MTC7]|nr:hypothetical protein A4S06_08780 [Erysipelotrichaceae bacterium MTC7]